MEPEFSENKKDKVLIRLFDVTTFVELENYSILL